MIDETKLRETIAKNIAYFRKNMNLTQLELAEKLNYSDKSVSKWERAEAIPDAIVLKQLAEMFHVRIDDLMEENAADYKHFTISIRKRVLIPIMSAMLVFLVATLTFAILVWVRAVPRPWLAFVFALPATSIVLIVFSAIAKNRVLITLFVSILIWSAAFTIFVLFEFSPQVSLVFIIAVPLEILTVLWHFFIKPSNEKQKLQQ